MLHRRTHQRGSSRTHRLARASAASALVAGALALSACGGDTSGSEVGADVGDIVAEDGPPEAYDGPYDAGFSEAARSYDGQEVTVSANVNEVVSPTSFTIAGTEATDVDPLLIVSPTKVDGLQEGTAVQVTGTVHQAFDLPTVEEGVRVDLDDSLYGSYDQLPYIEATSIDTSVEE